MNCSNCGSANLANAKYCSSCGKELPKQPEAVEVQPEQPAKKTSETTKKIAQAVGGIVGFAIAYFIGQHFFFKTPSVDKKMSTVATEMNKTCPMMADEYSRLDSATTFPDKIFQYNFTLVNLEKSEVNLDTVKKYVEPGILNNAKTNPAMQPLRDNKVTLVYNYMDKKGVFVLKITVTPDMYK